jgi:hypothetical protein
MRKQQMSKMHLIEVALVMIIHRDSRRPNFPNRPCCSARHCDLARWRGCMHVNELTLLGIMLLLPHGMLLVGLPYCEPALQQIPRASTHYGANQVELSAHDQRRESEKTSARALGQRVAAIAKLA